MDCVSEANLFVLATPVEDSDYQCCCEENYDLSSWEDTPPSGSPQENPEGDHHARKTANYQDQIVDIKG